MNPTKNQNEECASCGEVRECENYSIHGDAPVCGPCAELPSGLNDARIAARGGWPREPLPDATQEKWEPKCDERVEARIIDYSVVEADRGKLVVGTFWCFDGQEAMIVVGGSMRSVDRSSLRPAQDAPGTAGSVDPAHRETAGATPSGEVPGNSTQPVEPERPSCVECAADCAVNFLGYCAHCAHRLEHRVEDSSEPSDLQSRITQARQQLDAGIKSRRYPYAESDCSWRTPGWESE